MTKKDYKAQNSLKKYLDISENYTQGNINLENEEY